MGLRFLKCLRMIMEEGGMSNSDDAISIGKFRPSHFL